MLPNFKQVGLGVIVFTLSVSFLINFCSCEDDFQTSVDHFMDAIDDDINSATTEQVFGLGNEIPGEVPTVAEEPAKENEVSFIKLDKSVILSKILL